MTANIDTPMGTAQNGEQTHQREFENKHQLAARLGVSVRTIDNLLKRGLPYIRLTRKLLRFPRVAVDEWLAETPGAPLLIQTRTVQMSGVIHQH